MSFRGQLQRVPSPTHLYLPSTWICCQWGGGSNGTRLLLRMLEKNLGWILSSCVGSSLHIKWTVCLSTKNGCSFAREGEVTVVFAHLFHRGYFGQLQVGKGGGRRKSLVSLHFLGKERGYTVSHHLVSSSLHFLFPFHIWQLSKLTSEGKQLLWVWAGWGSHQGNIGG